MPLYQGAVTGSGDFSDPASGFSATATFSGPLSVSMVINNSTHAISGTYQATVSYTSVWDVTPPGNPAPPSGALGSTGTESGTAPNVNVTTTSGPLAFSTATVNGGSLTGGGTVSLSGFNGTGSFTFSATASAPSLTLTAPGSVQEGSAGNVSISLSGASLISGDVYSFEIKTNDGTALQGVNYTSLDQFVTLSAANHWTAVLPIQTLQDNELAGDNDQTGTDGTFKINAQETAGPLTVDTSASSASATVTVLESGATSPNVTPYTSAGVAAASYLSVFDPYGPVPLLGEPPTTLNTTDSNGNPITLTRVGWTWDPTHTQQYVAYKTPDNRIIIGIEGTDNLPNQVTDVATWGLPGNSPSSGFVAYLDAAASFISQVKANNPNDPIFLTGHSLGGAMAQILGYYLDLPATAFNGPGPGAFMNSAAIATAMADGLFIPSGYNPATDYDQPNTNISNPGDLVHKVGQSYGTQEMIQSNDPFSMVNMQDHWWQFPGDHAIANLLPLLQQANNPSSGVTISSGSGEADPYLHLPIEVITTGSRGPGNSSQFNVTVSNGTLHVFDPPSGSRFVFSLAQDNPQMTSFLLPDDGKGISSFKVWTETNGVWSQPSTYTLGTVINLNPNLQAIQFEAFDASGQIEVLPAQYMFFATFAASGTFAGSITAYDVHAQSDFLHNGTSDVLWRNNTTGAVETWLMTNGHVTGGTGVGTASSKWQILGTGDFNGDGTSDVLWRNTTSGEIDTWLLGNGHLVGGTGVGLVASAWQFAGTGDLNGDGATDVLWRNVNTGEVDAWLMSDGHIVGGSAIGSVSSVWQVVGVGDFNGDGTSDVLWRNTTTGEVDSWLMTNGRVTGGTAVGIASSAWQILGTGDFNGDGTTDVVWRNSATGEIDTWLIGNGHIVGGTGVGAVSSAWQFIGSGDYNGDGTADMLWRNTSTGEVDTWLINNGHLVGGSAIGSVSSAWTTAPSASGGSAVATTGGEPVQTTAAQTVGPVTALLGATREGGADFDPQPPGRSDWLGNANAPFAAILSPPDAAAGLGSDSFHTLAGSFTSLSAHSTTR